MKFLHDRKRAGVVALLSVLLGAAALVVGAGSASAATGRCDDEPVPGDVWVNAGNQVIVGVDQSVTSGEVTIWACEHVSPAPATWHDVKVTVGDQNSATPGYTADVATCDVAACYTTLAPTGAEVEPTVTPNAPLGGATGSGASAGTGPATCTYVNNSTPTCGFGATIGGLTVNEADASVPTTHPNAGGCVTVGGSCVTTVPSGMGVKVLSGSSSDTVTVTAGSTTRSEDLGGCYGFNAGTGC